ncbi:MAG: peptidoglycan DD-metalloendopeptidase family protein, partial [Alphaproteobacteria bacterium]|nr:peptidoglycan DD-metalloendopeptidase family protein [Alphaproteobacteria bacterium]
ASAHDAVIATQARIAALAARLQAAEADVGAGLARINVIDVLQRRQRARLADKQQPAVQLIAALEMMARQPPALAFVHPGTMNDIVHVRAIFATILPTILARTADLRVDVARGIALRQQAELALAALHTSRANLVAQQKLLASAVVATQAREQHYGSNAMLEQDKAIAMGEKSRDIRTLMAEIETDGQTRDELVQLPGPLLRPPAISIQNPLPMTAASPSPQVHISYHLPVIGDIVSGMGEETAPGVRQRGLTIATQPDAVVVAPADGRIAYAGAYRGYGQIVIIDHGNGLTSLITSLAYINVHVGDTVIQGTPLGHAGNDLPTITIELRHYGAQVDIPAYIS